MKKLYKTLFTPAIFFALIFYSENGFAQCPDGSPSGGVAFDTTISFATGVTSRQLKFPKFDPETAMLTCVRLVVTITGIVDTVAMQNFSASPQTASFSYVRSDLMTGPGLTPSLSNSFNGNYGPYNLTAFDGIPNAGTDFKALPRDTVLKQVMSRTLTDSTEISQFYGSDSVTYNYDINVMTSAAITGGSASSLVLTSALVNFRFEYCTCPITTLPLGLRNFTLAKSGNAVAQLRWDAEASDEAYYYEVEMSRDGRSFSKVAVVNKINSTNPSYQHGYAIKNNAFGRYYFRVRQRWANGYIQYTEIKPVDFANPLFSTISVYPNPSTGNVGIKFVSVKAGKFLVQISNIAGQIVVTKEIMVAETDYKTVATLGAGMYYVKLTDIATQASCVNQLLVK